MGNLPSFVLSIAFLLASATVKTGGTYKYWVWGYTSHSKANASTLPPGKLILFAKFELDLSAAPYLPFNFNYIIY